MPISKIVDRYYKSIQQGVDVIEFVDRLDVFDNSKEGSDVWLRLFKFGPDRKFKLLIEKEKLPVWAIPLYKEAKGLS